MPVFGLVSWLLELFSNSFLACLWPPLIWSNHLPGLHKNHLIWVDLSLMALLEITLFWATLETSHEVQPPVWLSGESSDLRRLDPESPPSIWAVSPWQSFNNGSHIAHIVHLLHIHLMICLMILDLLCLNILFSTVSCVDECPLFLIIEINVQLLFILLILKMWPGTSIPLSTIIYKSINIIRTSRLSLRFLNTIDVKRDLWNQFLWLWSRRAKQS
jgi:hypothetical protein